MEKLHDKIGRATVNSIDYFRQLAKTLRHAGEIRSAEKAACIELNEVNTPRRLRQVSWLLRQAGYTVCVKIGWRDYIGYNQIGKDSFADAHTFLTPYSCSTASLYVTDTQPPANGRITKSLQIDYKFYPPDTVKFKNNCYIPIMFHPALMSAETYRYAAELSRNEDRFIGVLFAGSLDREKYNRSSIHSQYNLNTRNELIDSLLSNPDLKESVYQPADFSEFMQRKERGDLRSKLVIVDTAVCKIPQSEWLRILSETEFFLAAPGITMPFCHNLPESMAVGAIPILQFPGLLYPPLQDEETCIFFNSLDQLADKTGSLLHNANGARTERMRKNVTRYHNEYLSPQRFVSQINTFEKESRSVLKLIIARRMKQDE